MAAREYPRTRSGERTYVYESAGGAFRRELTVNDTGLVLEYPDYWHAEAAYDNGKPSSEKCHA